MVHLNFKRTGASGFWRLCAASEVCAAVAAVAASLEPAAFVHHLAGFTLLLQGAAAISAGCRHCLRRWRARRGVENIATPAAAGLAWLAGLAAGAAILTAYGHWLPGAAGALPVVAQLAVSTVSAAASLYVVRLRESNRRLRRDEVEARGHAAAQRLRHHFLFNALNTTVYLIRSHSEVAIRILIDLSELFRAMLQQKPTITLAEETEFVRRYIRIERVRLGARLGVEWRVPDAEYMRVKMPAMVMQPLVENAIYHGIETREEGGIIRIHIEAREQRVFFDIRNPVGDAASADHIAGNHMAQKSVRERLFHAYGTACRFTCKQRRGEYRVAFSIPQKGRR